MDITIPEISRDSDRGQVGIETLIIFIAMILVAAIAASVLINTAGYLQNQASATSEDSEAQVSNQVLVLSSIGEIQAVDQETGNFDFQHVASEALTIGYNGESGNVEIRNEDSHFQGTLYVNDEDGVSEWDVGASTSTSVSVSESATTTLEVAQFGDTGADTTSGNSVTIDVTDDTEDAKAQTDLSVDVSVLEHTNDNLPESSLQVDIDDTNDATNQQWNPTSNDVIYLDGNPADSDVTINAENDQHTLTANDSSGSVIVKLADTGDNVISDLSMTVMQSPGANEIDLEGASVEYIGPDGEATLGYSGSEEASTNDVEEEYEFGVEGTTDNDETAPVLTSRQDRFTMHISLTDNEDSDMRNLQEGEEATVRIVTQSGSTATAVINVPQSLSSYDNGDAVEV